MAGSEQYVRLSLELNLFFLRILKEHAIFAAASVPPKDAHISMQFVSMNRTLEALLSRAISLSQGNISEEVKNSSELVTEFTLPAEQAAQTLTGIPIDTTLTVREMNLGYRKIYPTKESIVNRVSALNQDIIKVGNSAVRFQTNILNQILSCKAFSYTYPLNLDHVIREARAYINTLSKLQAKRDKDVTLKELIEEEVFWNDIMEEHSKFIRGYLDPSETKLFRKANEFAEEFEKLEEKTKALVNNPSDVKSVTDDSYKLVTELRNFKRQGTEGLLHCKIKAIMPALLADHVTREANYYLRILRDIKI